MVTEQAAVHFANKTKRTFEQSLRFLEELKIKADKANAYKTKHPANSEWSEVNIWRDPKTGYVIWVVDNEIVHVIVKSVKPVE